MKLQVNQNFYFSKKYIYLGRFISYFYQVKYLYEYSNKRVLFVGVGDGMVPGFLRKLLDLVTFDIDPELNPDVVGDVRALPFKDGSFDVVCAFEVLEHMPFAESKQALKEIARVSRQDVLVSVPHRRTGFEMIVRFPYIQTFFQRAYLRLVFRIPIKFPGFAISTQHYWEIDGRSMKLRDFRKALSEHFFILDETTPVLDMYIRFFKLKKKSI